MSRRAIERHGKSDTPEYRVWTQMLTRCYNRRYKFFRDYGGRGIAVCDRWRRSFLAFLEDVGPRPSPQHSLGRLENDKNYEPGNVRWETRPEQARNTRRTRLVTWRGETLCLKDWAQKLGIGYITLVKRLDRGWPVDKAFSASVAAEYSHPRP